jgi:hypothetical protein
MNPRRRGQEPDPTPDAASETHAAEPETPVPAVEPDADEDFSAEAAPETVSFRESADKPNPLGSAYLSSRDNATGQGPDGLPTTGVQMRVPPAGKTFSEDRAKQAMALVRRAASDHNGGARTRIRKEGDGFALYFAWKPASERAYTSEQVRAWAGEQTPPIAVPEKGRVPLDVINQYRTAHGLPESKGGARKQTAETPAS